MIIKVLRKCTVLSISLQKLYILIVRKTKKIDDFNNI